MAGQPRTNGRTVRQRRRPRWEERAATAVTPAERMTLACDRLRSAVAKLRRGSDLEARAEADRLAREAEIFLAGLAEHAERFGDPR